MPWRPGAAAHQLPVSSEGLRGRRLLVRLQAAGRRQGSALGQASVTGGSALPRRLLPAACGRLPAAVSHILVLD